MIPKIIIIGIIVSKIVIKLNYCFRSIVINLEITLFVIMELMIPNIVTIGIVDFYLIISGMVA